MNENTLATVDSRMDQRQSDDGSPMERALQFDPASRIADNKQIVIAATFTADMLRRPLAFWMETLNISAEISFAPYAQVMQELLSPQSLLSQNKNGFNVLLIRLEDWIRDLPTDSVERNLDQVSRAAKELVAAISANRARTKAEMLIVLCPLSTSLPATYAQPLKEIQNQLRNQMSAQTGISCWDNTDLMRLYPVLEYQDAVADRLGHIPYTNEYFVAVGTLLARRICVFTKPQHKVIALDCDNTLWKGICGEDGAARVELTPAHVEFQKMLVRQHDAGILLCLCSKNNESDVEAVFKVNPEMPLREEHLICSRVNWKSKSSNLRELAQELDLSIDSFIFIDDSSLECAEVGAHCPSVLTLQFPQDADEIANFLEHTWVFDRIGITYEAKQRTAKYKQNRARSEAMRETADLHQFLASLELKVDVAPMQSSHLTRVAELIQRTNQFNLTTIRRSAGEIEALCNSGGVQILVVHVRDRFGDYGLVGALLLRLNSASVEVDTFLLSCRVLGRGVEHRIVNKLGQMARESGRSRVVLRYRQTERNAPAWTFLDHSFRDFQTLSNGHSAEIIFTIPSEYAENLRLESVNGKAGSAAVPLPISDSGASTMLSNCSKWLEVAHRLSRVPDIVQEINRCTAKEQQGSADYVAPRTATEVSVAAVWAEVLGLEKVSVRADFLELGGDSLLAVQVIARLGAVLGAELSVFDFFEGPTVEKVAARLAATGSSEGASAIERIDRTGAIPLSSAQRRLWFIDQLEAGSTAYHIPLAIRLCGELDRVALQAALDALIERHETLRTAFVMSAGQPVQKILPVGRFPLPLIDLRGLEAQARAHEVERQAKEDLTLPFNLSTGPAIRARMLQLSEDEHVLLVTMHHIVTDGWSIGVLISELSSFYGDYREGRSSSLPPLPIQYADYAQWQIQRLEGAELQQKLAYWREHLLGAPELLELPTDRPRPAMQSYRGASTPVLLAPDLVQDLRNLSKRLNLTLAMTLYTAWCIVLARLSGQSDIVLGMPVANRLHADLEGLIGLFVNTLAVRVQLEDDPTVDDLLQRVKHIMLGAYANQDVPFDRVVEVLQPARSLSHSPIFQVMFVLQNTPRGVLRLPGLTLAEQAVSADTTKFDMTLSLQESTDGIIGSINYATDLFDAETIEKWIACFGVVLRGMTKDHGRNVSRLPLMTEDERHKVINQFNATASPYPRGKLIHELFEEQVQRTPWAIAVAYNEQSLTYAQLNENANQLARFLRSKGVGPDQLVALYLERSVEMLVGVLGVLKAGGAYIPMDPANPAERLQYMLADANPRVVLSQEKLRHVLPGTAAELIALDDDWAEIAQQSSENLEAGSLQLHSGHLAYVIYTSGSTGKPKGVMVEHRNIVNYALHVLRQFDVGSGDGSLICTSMSFDLMLTGLYPTLLCGRTVRLCRDLQGLPTLKDEVLKCSNLAPLKLTPSHLALLQDPLRSGELIGRVRVLVLGGEPLRADVVRSWRAHAPGTRIFNHYGPTETTVGCVVNEIEELVSDPVPIGRPISNTQIYILDRHRQPVPIGVIGEIYIGGANVARGYLNRSELTSERFVPDPFSTDSNARMYRSGDLGRWRAEGAIEYLGRNDHQVKIRGFRIELGEIESHLVRYEWVSTAVVTAREDVPGEKRLVAYVVPSEPSCIPSIDGLRAHLRTLLPEYMVPAAFVMMERLPVTQNGKLDRRALPVPEAAAYARRQYEMPQGEVEEILAGIWQALLRVDRIGRRDNFFELGGHSLLIVQMLERLRRVGLSAEVRRVFESPTLADLALALTRDVAGNVDIPPNLIPTTGETITPQMLTLVGLDAKHIDHIVRSVPGGAANIKDIYPLAPLQEGILFHYLLNEDRSDTYVVPTLLSVSSKQRLDELIAALQAVIDRHDILRTAVLWENLPSPVQVVYRRAQLQVEVLASDDDLMEQLRKSTRPELQRLDLRHAPLLRLRVAADHDGRWHVLLLTHHIVSDHVTLESMTSEIVAHLQRREHTLPESVPYRNHVAQALAYASKHDAEAFFRHKLGDVREPTAPFGLLDVHGDGSRIEQAQQELTAELAARIRVQARRFAVSAASLFHAAWALVVACTSGRDDVVFGTVMLGRLQGSAGAQRIIGMFINTLPLRLKLHGVTAKELVDQTQLELVELFGHEQASLALAQHCSGTGGSGVLFTTLFNYRHGTPSPATQWSNADGFQAHTVEGRTNYPITFSVDDWGDRFTLTAQTDRRIDPHRMTSYMGTALQSLIDALEQEPERAATALAVLPEEMLNELVHSFNATRVACLQQKLIHELFEDQVQRTPNTVAIEYQAESLSYAELNAKGNQLAHYLRSIGIGPDQLVGICVARSVEMVIGLLGVLKAGGAYLPLDPAYPFERLQYMLDDAAPHVVLTQKELRAALPATKARVVELSETLSEITGCSKESLPATELGLTPQNLVYVIYTSGSTGRPKGTAMPHRAMVNLIEWHRHDLRIDAGQRVLQFAALSFDVAFQEIFSTLCTGGTLVLLDEWVRKDARALLDLLSSGSIERLFVPPLMLQSLAECFRTMSTSLRALKDVITAGEQLRITPEIVNFFKRLDGCRLHNHYGPTETHVVTALTLVEDPDEWPMLPTIGQPIWNTQIYILDERRLPVPLGVTGEIYIGGANVAHGYLRRPELTAERFVPDSFSADARGRLYKTGDLGRWQAGGTIEYLGRNDDQVKIRGYRIELSEIEAQLVGHQRVREAAIVVREDIAGEKRLVAYFITADHGGLSIEELRAHLRNVMPEYMVPSAFVKLEKLPLTPSGKLDRRALPAPEMGAYATSGYEPPQGEAEENLARIWQEVLQVDRVGRGDSFFELGGHSLLVLKALTKINQSFTCALRVMDIYKSPTISELAERICRGAVEDDFIDLSREAALDHEIVPTPGDIHVPARAVMLTGGTGFVGRFLLAQLLQDTDADIYCLVRARSQREALSRIRETLWKWDLWHDEFALRITAIPSDLRLPRLGVDEFNYKLLSEKIDIIYHCATSMNHLETYAMARAANVQASKELIELANRHRPKLINYISTLGVFSRSTVDTTRVVSEDSPIDDEKHSSSSGYAASKWVGEKIFMNAGARGVPCNIFRLGFVWADTQQGRYDELQRGYRLIKSCLMSGYGIKNYRHEFPPTPVDYVARAVVLLANRHANGRGIFHISSSSQITEGVFERCNEIAGTSLRLLPLYGWVGEMKRLHYAGLSLPIVPLIESAFSMDKESFNARQSLASWERIRFNCVQTQQELEQAGIVTPALDDNLLALCLESMSSRDTELLVTMDPVRISPDLRPGNKQWDYEIRD